MRKGGLLLATMLGLAGCGAQVLHVSDRDSGMPSTPGSDAAVAGGGDLATPVTPVTPVPDGGFPPTASNPILFVTQVPIAANFTSIGNTFGNQRTEMDSVARGGDLYIVYPDGTLKNLTQLAGYGSDGLQGANAIAVREPSVHWSGTKALFSMVVGAPTQQYEVADYFWQLYEVTGLGSHDTPVITKVADQPAGFNNVAPFYGSDERVLFTSDRPRTGEAHLYPQLDEYEEAPTVTGLWSLDPATGDLFQINHSPSGLFYPTLDSFGRIIFTRWDHLQRDQQADSDAMGGGTYNTFNYADETAGAAKLNVRTEVFPEPRSSRTDLLAGTNLVGEDINLFFPWSIDEDGSEEETINHIGRHELSSYFANTLNDDPNLPEFSPPSDRVNANSINNFLQIKEDPLHPGTYYGTDAPEFYTNAAGQIISMTAPPGLPADSIVINYITHRDTEGSPNPGTPPSANNSGKYRNPVPLADGTLIAVHTSETHFDYNVGTADSPRSAYYFRIKHMTKNGAYWAAGQPLTAGIMKTVSYWTPDVKRSFSGEMWELDPVEVRARAKPVRRAPKLETPEQTVFSAVGVDPATLQAYLKQKNLALIVSRNVTTRDRADKQQPFNLHVAGSTTQTVGASGKIYDVSRLQLFQADQLRGLGGTASPRPGRRVLAQALHDANAIAANPAAGAGDPPGSVALGSDGSLAAFVPARRALSWQLTAPSGTPVVRERYWVSFQAGEIRVCASCHGINSKDQAGNGVPQSSPEALRALLTAWKAQH